MTGKHEAEKTPAELGGEARANALTPEARSQIARKAAAARWAKGLTQATHEGTLKIGDIEFACSVLDDNDKTRVLSEMEFMEGMGMYRSGALSTRRSDEEGGARVPLYLAFKNLKPHIEKHLGGVHASPVIYRTRGGLVAHGIRADIIPRICEVWLDARAEGVLGSTQEKVAAKAELLMRGLAHVGIVALVDEATGYQAERDRNELRLILKAYVSEALLPWTERFPDEFFDEMFRLRGWQRHPLAGSRGPRYAGKLVNELVYKKLPPGVLEKLEDKNPKEHGQRKHRHHQYLTLDMGNTHLERQVASVVTLMRASPTWGFFKDLFDRAFPALPATKDLPLSDDA